MLLLDAGNSRCKWAWLESGSQKLQGVLDNSDAAGWQALKTEFSVRQAPRKILVSNVAGSVMAQRLAELCAVWQCPLEFIIARAEQCGVRNGYEDVSQLGSDRWAALLAAWDRVRGACLVVNCGTATTVDALSETGEFLGGLILPGISLMRHGLLNSTAQLESGNGKIGNFPRNTADAIASGVMWANIGAVQHQYYLLAAQYKARCLVSGGAASLMLPYLEIQTELVEDLVLQGLYIIGQGCSTMTNMETVAR